VTILRQPPERFPFDGERGEYLATLALALACSGKLDEADRAASEAEDFATTVEVRSLSGCTRAILGIAQAAPAAVDVAQTALGIVLDSGGVDSFVCAYRGYPELLRALVHNPELRHHLHSILLRAKDEALATSSGLDKTIRRAPSVLSPREREVLELLAEGLTNKEIARTLFISEATAKIHVRHILQKLRVRTRTEAALRLAEVVESD
jgi:DNA-binding CsgD family transcriptional regulator